MARVGDLQTRPLEGPAITYDGKLADGAKLSGEQVVKEWGRPMGSAPPPVSVDESYKLIEAKDNDPALTRPRPRPLEATPSSSSIPLFRGSKFHAE